MLAYSLGGRRVSESAALEAGSIRQRNGRPGAAIAPRHVEPVDDKTFLRGTQLTDAAGAVQFRTIYPGWYSGRTPHVHLKFRVGAKAASTQLYFPDEVTNAGYARAPYDRHPNRDTTNATDRFLGRSPTSPS
jgi:protocatechuate 3,4-dioxygenase beta subunit